jgi:hypothetical protein
MPNNKLSLSKTEQLIRIKDEFRKANGDAPASARTILDWAVEKGLYKVDMAKARQRAAEELADAMRAEMVLDSHGNEIHKNLAFETESGWLWDDRETIGRRNFELSIQANRRMSYATIRSSVLSVNDWNERHPDEPPVQYSLNFKADLADDGITPPASSIELEQLIEPPRPVLADSASPSEPVPPSFRPTFRASPPQDEEPPRRAD